MKAIILNGSKNGSKDQGTIGMAKMLLEEGLKKAGWNVEVMELAEKKIGGCRGCFSCFIRTPGVCIQDDDGRELVRCAVQYDLVVYLTPVTFGGYSSELKKAIDRRICLSLPYFDMVGGELHHPKRYEKYADLAVVGIMPWHDEDMARTFNELFKRNLLNVLPKRSAVSVLVEGEGPSNAAVEINRLLMGTGVAR